MQSRILFVITSLAFLCGFSACSSAPVEEVESFRSRGRPANAAPPPTATPMPTAQVAGPVTAPSPVKGNSGTTPPRVAPEVKGTAPPAASPKSEEGGEVVEWIVADPDSPRARAQKLREKRKKDLSDAPTGGADK